MSETVKIDIPLRKAYEELSKTFKDELDQANDALCGTVRLLITLSSSFLVLGVALVDKVFPIKESPVEMQVALVSSWVLFLLVVVFGVIAELGIARFFQTMAASREHYMKLYLAQISQGLETTILETDLQKSFRVKLPLLWVILEANAFLFAMVGLVLFFAGNIYPITKAWFCFSLFSSFVVIGALNFCLREKAPDQSKC